jgi:hypothetical protein
MRNQIGRGWFGDRSYFALGDPGLELSRNGFGNFTLDRKNVGDIAIVGLRPEMRICAGVDELGIDSHPMSDALDATFRCCVFSRSRLRHPFPRSAIPDGSVNR